METEWHMNFLDTFKIQRHMLIGSVGLKAEEKARKFHGNW